mgnify:CR=1 FL=1
MEDNILNEKTFYNAKDIQKILGVGRSRAYDYLKEVYDNGQPFKVIKIGTIYKIPVLSFNNWINRISE